MNLSSSEKIVIKAIINNADNITPDIKKQFEKLTIKNRDYTGTGMYVYFNIAVDNSNDKSNINRMLGGIHAEVENLKHGAGFILYIRNGLISTLECYSYDEMWPLNEFNVKKVFKVKKDGDLQELSAF